MPKERKTKSQKIAAETRHYLYHFEERSPLPKKVESPTIAQPTLQSQNVQTISLRDDAIKTASLVSLIVATELLILFLLKNNLVHIGGLIY
ncbi:MAG: hypothetical protein A2152_01210 [Candidatus Levybacteria bacterium RBG_16_35_6]|nr:MAG: hypothetical protein US02_C0013G0009 [Candidatus Levybacteria bacterium GW2011_GWA2_36_13]OGH10139.1 MAG: hypothetical protein A2152_01210 [Candidatus Levybacteria bacterium RBG_16_35_6]